MNISPLPLFNIFNIKEDSLCSRSWFFCLFYQILTPVLKIVQKIIQKIRQKSFFGHEPYFYDQKRYWKKYEQILEFAGVRWLTFWIERPISSFKGYMSKYFEVK